MFYKLIISFFLLFCVSTFANASYYVDAVNGSDTNDGSKGAPWATLEKARDTITSPSTVYVYSGNYNNYSEVGRNSRVGYLSFVAVQNNLPVIEGLNIDNSSYVEFNGFKIHRTPTQVLVNIKNSVNVMLNGCDISSTRWSVDSGNMVTAITIGSSSKIKIANTKIYEVGRGLQIAGSTDIDIKGNYIAVKGGTAIQYLSNNINVTVDSNHIRGEMYTPYPEDPLAFKSPHQSGISIRSDNITIKNNVIHGLGSTAGIMTYTLDAAGGEISYDNITIENNSIYNTVSTYAIRFYNAGENIVLKNNLIFSRIRTGECVGRTNDARYMYSAALAVHSLAETSDGSGISLINNIFVGAVFVPTTINEEKNIFWSLSSGGWQSASPKGNSKVIVSSYLGCGKAPTLFEDGTFFSERINMFFPEIINVDFRLSESSLAKNYGNPFLQSKKALGQVESNNFIVNNGPARNEKLHSSGPYEPYFLLAPPKDFLKLP